MLGATDSEGEAGDPPLGSPLEEALGAPLEEEAPVAEFYWGSQVRSLDMDKSLCSQAVSNE